MNINQSKIIKKRLIFRRQKKILKTTFLVLLLSLTFIPIFSQASTNRLFLDLCPRDAPGCYEFRVREHDADSGIYIEKGVAFFPGLVPCGVRVCIGEDWTKIGTDINPDFTRLPYRRLRDRECRGAAVGIGGGIRTHSCTLCHLFIMFFAIVSFIFVDLVPFLAVIIIAFAGATIALAGGYPDLVKKGTSIIKGVAIGLVLIYGAFIITSTFFALLGVIQWKGFDGNLFSVTKCDIIILDERTVRPIPPPPVTPTP